MSHPFFRRAARPFERAHSVNSSHSEENLKFRVSPRELAVSTRNKIGSKAHAQLRPRVTCNTCVCVDRRVMCVYVCVHVHSYRGTYFRNNITECLPTTKLRRFLKEFHVFHEITINIRSFQTLSNF